MHSRWPRLLFLAAILAAVEVFGTIALGFFTWDRAEAGLFLSLRPLVLIAGVLAVGREPWRDRLLFYVLLLTIAATSETLLVLALGATDPLPEAARGVAAGALLTVAADLLSQSIRFLVPYRRWSFLVFLAASVLVLAIPNGLAPYHWMLEPKKQRSGDRPDVMLMTSLPIIWGEGGAFDPSSKPAEAYKSLQSEFHIRPIDFLDQESLGSGKLLLLAHPRALNPQELVALDRWVLRGGKVLILTDPFLGWQSSLPVGDPRRPPAVGLLGPILTHWGLELEPNAMARAPTRRDIGKRRVEIFTPGIFRTYSPRCGLREDAFVADCRIGTGRAMVVADADLLHDRFWTSGAGSDRRTRAADNPLFVADLLDQLLATERPRIAGDVQWAARPRLIQSPLAAILLSLMPVGVALGCGFILRRKARS